MNNIVSFYIAGLKFRTDEDIAVIKQGLVLKLEAEPDNPFDPNAIKVMDQENHHLGYVPKKITSELHPYRICNIPIFVVIANYIPEMPTHKRVLIAVKSNQELPKYIPLQRDDEPFTDFICLDKIDEEQQT